MDINQIAEQAAKAVFALGRRLFPSSIWNGEYIGGILEKYTSGSGFFIGLVLLTLVLCASDWVQNASLPRRKRGIIRILALVAFINALDGIYFYMASAVSSHLFPDTVVVGGESLLQGAFNPLSVMIVSLVVAACYDEEPGKAFFFGTSTFGLVPILFGSVYGLDFQVVSVFRAVFMGIVCSIGSKREHVFSIYIWLTCVCVITQAVMTTLVFNFIHEAETIGVMKLILFHLAEYKTQYFISAVIAAIWMLYELCILKERKPKRKKVSAA